MNSNDRRKPLSFLVAANQQRRDGSVRLVVPFSADLEPGGMPVRITEVRQQTASWVSLLDERKTGTINLSNVMVDPSEIEWRAPIMRVLPAELEVLPTAPPAALITAPEPSTKEKRQQKEFDRAVDRLVAEGHPEPLKHCPTCKQQKPKSEFPAGKGFSSCNDCRNSKPDKPPHTEAVERNQELAEEGKKRCGSCRQEKPLEAFNKNASKGDGYQSICRQCISATWTTGSTAHRQAKETKETKALSAIDIVPTPVQKQGNDGQPARTFKELIPDLRKLRAERDEAVQTVAELRQELSDVYAALQEVTAGI